MLSRLFPAFLVIFVLSSTALARSAFSEPRLARAFPPPPILARAGLVMNADNGVVLAAKNPHLRLPMASTTKIMTAVVALQSGQLSDRIRVPSSAFDFESDATVMGLHTGQTVTLRDLLYGLMLPSGADAANVIAIRYGGSEQGFVAMMNRKAQQLGMHDTHYANAHGLTAPDHYTSAYDMALLARYASTIPALMKVASTRTYHWDGHILTNLNRVLFWYPGADGLKPGFTDDAGLCQVLDAHRDGRHVVVVLLNTPNLDTDARNMLDFALRDFSWVVSRLPGDQPNLVQSGIDGAGPFYYFPASGHYLRGKFLTAFSVDGGLDTLGFPRTEPLLEHGSQIQYFQNGALSLDPSNGRLSRVAVGLTPLPTATPTPFPTVPAPPPPTATPYSPPVESTVVAPTGTVTPVVRSRPVRVTSTSQPLPTMTPVATSRQPHATPTFQPLPLPILTSTPIAVAPLFTAKVFVAYQRSHRSTLGAVAGQMRYIQGYRVQIFAYGALAYHDQTRSLFQLPIGDRLLVARHFLPKHPGNSYPAGFAPLWLQRTIGWINQ